MTPLSTPKDAGAYFYQDINNPQRLYLHIATPTTPYLQVLTGGVHRRFLLVCSNAICHAGVVERDYDGVMVVRHHAATPASPITPISRHDVIHYQAHCTTHTNTFNDKPPYWQQWYAKSLLNNQHHFLSQGTYLLAPASHLLRSKATFIDKTHCYVDWWHRCDDIIIPLKSLPPPDSGRVKWHKKLIAQGICPPLLLWFLPHISAYLLVDGHARLVAHRLLGSTPDMLEISQYQSYSYQADTHRQAHILANLEKALNNGAQFHTNHLNDILLKAYAPCHYERATLTAKPIAQMDALWLDVVERLAAKQSDDKAFIDTMISI